MTPTYCRKCGAGPFLTAVAGQDHYRTTHPRQGLAARVDDMAKALAMLAADIEELEAKSRLEEETRGMTRLPVPSRRPPP